MRRVIGIILTAAIAVAVAWWVAHLPGQASFTIGEFAVEASASVMVLAAVILFVVLYIFARVIAYLLSMPMRLRRWRRERNRSFGDIAVNRTLLALAAGDEGDARREAARARRLLGATPQTLLLSAQAGQLAGRDAEAEGHFRALAEREDVAFVGLRGLLRLALARQDWQEAADIARRAEAAHPGAAWLREERAQLAIRSGAWREALTLSGSESQRAALGVAAAEAEAEPAAALRLAKQAYRDDPALTPAVMSYVRNLRAFGHERRALGVLRNAWAVNPHPDIAEAFLARSTDSVERVKYAQRLAEANLGHPETEFMLAKAALAAGDTATARRRAQAAQARMNQRRVWALIAEIEEREHGDGEAMRQALRGAATAQSDPTWRCDACGTAHDTWHAVCPTCQATARMRWVSIEQDRNVIAA
jgi:HemY protein